MKIKKTIGVLASLVIAASSFGQGVITFNNSGTSRVIDSNTGEAVGQGIAVAGLYFSTDLSATPDLRNPEGDGFVLGATTDITTSPLAFLAGLYNGGNVQLAGTAPGQQVLVQVRAWSAGFSDYTDAWRNGDNTTLVGGSDLIGPVGLGGGAIPPPATSSFVNSFTLTPVPEPSTVVLGLLGGLGAMVLLRRRK